ncbi:MAG: alkaline phosphatase family protein [Bacteroidetes bacterium]|nr:MAG: alkaline phosphatase family protein [Bacteroidota bacterium]
MHNRFFLPIFLFLLLSVFARSQESLLQSGPMLGYIDMKEALLWAQTQDAATVDFEYWDLDNPDVRYTTDAVQTAKASGFTAKCIADRVEPGHRYAYTLRINGQPVPRPYPTEFQTQPLWQWRTDPPPFSVATGSCAYINEPEYDRPGKPYGSDYHIFTAMHAQRPDLMVWLGDNTYYREPDWTTRTGMFHRYTHDRSLPELQPLLASTHQYAIWDDHDYGPNDSDGTWVHKETAWEVFRAFWGNPTYGLPGQKGCTTWFKYMDVDFFLLDNRYFRTPNYCTSCDRTLLGHTQFDWLKAALAASRAPFKIIAVGNQVLTTNNADETYAHYFRAERDSLLAHIERENIRGVIFLTGDRHFTELSTYKNAAGNWVYDLTTSSLTAGSYAKAGERTTNDYRIEGTVVDQHNFSILRFSGPRTSRQVTITNYDADGKERWSKTILPNGELEK